MTGDREHTGDRWRLAFGPRLNTGAAPGIVAFVLGSVSKSTNRHMIVEHGFMSRDSTARDAASTKVRPASKVSPRRLDDVKFVSRGTLYRRSHQKPKDISEQISSLEVSHYHPNGSEPVETRCLVSWSYQEPTALGSRHVERPPIDVDGAETLATHDREVFNEHGRLSSHSSSAPYRPGPRYTILPLPNDVGGAEVNNMNLGRHMQHEV